MSIIIADEKAVEFTISQQPVELLVSWFDEPGGYKRYDSGMVMVSLGDRRYTFHPLEWTPARELNQRNPLRGLPIDPVNIERAKEIQDRINLAWDMYQKRPEDARILLTQPFSWEC